MVMRTDYMRILQSIMQRSNTITQDQNPTLSMEDLGVTKPESSGPKALLDSVCAHAGDGQPYFKTELSQFLSR